ncbi:MAG: outer membrane protein transport protein [Gammaproteobacteria bacterium]
MRLFSKMALAFSLVASITVPTSVFATNGYFLIGYGAKSRSMGGVGVAYAQDALAAGANPAGMADVKVSTMRIDFGGEYFRPKRAFIHDSQELESNFPGSTSAVNHTSGSNDFLIPSAGGIYKFNRKLTIGMAVVGAGANSRYDQKVPGNPTCLVGDTSGGTASTAFNFNCIGGPTVGVNLIQMQMLPSVAYKVNKNHFVGASLAIGVQTFRAYGLQAFGPTGLGYTTGSKFTNQGNDWSYGAGVRVGWLGKFLKKRLTLGANYSSRVYMTEFDKYKDLFAEQGDFDIPSNWSLGLAYKLTDNIDVAFDYQRINYTDVSSISNKGPDASNPITFFPSGCVTLPSGDNSCILGADDGMGFGWDDADVFKVGINYDYNDKWSFRAGYNYAESPIQEDQVLFNFLAPAVTEHHLTLGASYRPDKNIEWSFNYSHAFSNTIKGQTALGPNGSAFPVVSPNTNGAIDMEINTFGVSFGYSL